MRPRDQASSLIWLTRSKFASTLALRLAGNGKKPTSAPAQPGCCSVAPLRPHAVRRAHRRSLSLDGISGTEAQAILKNLGWKFYSMAKLVFGLNQSLDGYVAHDIEKVRAINEVAQRSPDQSEVRASGLVGCISRIGHPGLSIRFRMLAYKKRVTHVWEACFEAQSRWRFPYCTHDPFGAASVRRWPTAGLQSHSGSIGCGGTSPTLFS